jgi:glycosyltransferase involved in cell wall biosynthesis
MRIGIIYQGTDFPPSERIEKTARSLTAAGHEVFLICNNDGRFPLSEEQVGDVHVLRVRPTFRNVAPNKIVKFPAPFNPLWLGTIASAIVRFKLEALQVVDIPLAMAALFLGRVFGKPVVLDMWENYPEALRGWAQHKWTTRIFKNPDLARAVERYAVPRMDHIFTVVDEQKTRLIHDGVTADRISVVTNGVDLDLLMQTPVRNDTPMDAEPDDYKLLYVGELTIERGLDDIIRALKFVKDAIPHIRFYMAGSGSYELHLRSLVEEEKVGDLIRFLGWLPFGEIHSYIAKSDLCLVPHVYNDFINTTMPNKLFQYMALAKPVLVSNAKPLARIVRECDCGFVFESRNPRDAADRILEAYQARSDRGIGERGRLCVGRKYTWECASVGLLECYDMLSRMPAG